MKSVTQTSVPQATVAIDSDLEQWGRDSSPEETCEVIVELAHERRSVVVEPVVSRSGRPAYSIKGVVGDAVTEPLQQLIDWLKNELALEVVPLRAARACAVRATPAALLKMMKSPLIRAIKPNRRLR